MKNALRKTAVSRICNAWLTTAFIMLALPGCSIFPPYPSNFPALELVSTKLETCPPIAGRYSDIGEAVDSDGNSIGSVSLTNLLHIPDKLSAVPEVVVVSDAGERVQIDSFRGTERVAVWQQAKLTKEAYLANGDSAAGDTYLCQDGYVRLGRSYGARGGGAGPLIVLGVRSDFLWLRRANDGSLVVLHTDLNGYAIMMLFPVGTANRVWYRFPPLVLPESSSGTGNPGH